MKGKASKAPTKPKIVAAKPSNKGKSAPGKRVLVDRNDNAEDSGAEDTDRDTRERDAPQRDGLGKKKTASETYTKVCDSRGTAC